MTTLKFITRYSGPKYKKALLETTQDIILPCGKENGAKDIQRRKYIKLFIDFVYRKLEFTVKIFPISHKK